MSFIAVPLLLSELLLMVMSADDVTRKSIWKLGVALLVTVVLGPPGEIQDDMLVGLSLANVCHDPFL